MIEFDFDMGRTPEISRVTQEEKPVSVVKPGIPFGISPNFDGTPEGLQPEEGEYVDIIEFPIEGLGMGRISVIKVKDIHKTLTADPIIYPGGEPKPTFVLDIEVYNLSKEVADSIIISLFYGEQEHKAWVDSEESSETDVEHPYQASTYNYWTAAEGPYLLAFHKEDFDKIRFVVKQKN